MAALLNEIERHLRATRQAPTRFGREAACDPRLVSDLRRGREPRGDLAARVLAYIAARGAPPVQA